ncbi:hypothetical protein KO527_24395 [Pseudoalteromonas sp. C2R02]|uniref:hypothetical protein n=1 Tax=Pseudoalteromonas sp. C2R02 TaxID=2841565 RepID=UPI001C08AB40|nr:hypothetical protein [Pseudoalteromonas sp. C2R02]MBU2972479.1 hypothetical protein [Pseudoalteromonas sp. C2R02]
MRFSMDDYEKLPPGQERRHSNCPSSNLLWCKLNDAQKSAVTALHGYGYELTFIRIVEHENLAILLLDGNPATVDVDGEIDTSPEIIVRH